jgi:hypothetical protein
MALYERKAEFWTSACGRQSARESMTGFSFGYDEPKLNDRESVIDGQTKGEGWIDFGIAFNSNALTTTMHGRDRHDLALICPTVAENNSYVSIMSKQLSGTSKEAHLEHVTRTDRCALNLKFRGSAVRSTSDRDHRFSGSTRSTTIETAAMIDSVRSGAKGEIEYHATV